MSLANTVEYTNSTAAPTWSVYANHVNGYFTHTWNDTSANVIATGWVTTGTYTGDFSFSAKFDMATKAVDQLQEALIGLTIEAPGFTPIKRRSLPKKSVGEVLRHAARLIEEHGWIKGALQTADGLCTLGAIALASHGSANGLSRLQSEATKYLGEYLGLGNRSVPNWNDASKRTREQVLDALNGAAAQWEAAHA